MRARTLLLAVALVAPFGAGCRQDMHNQPKYKPLRESAFFADHRTSRPAIEGVVPRGPLRTTDAFYTGRADGQLVKLMPVTLDERLVARGQERFNIYCSPCHGRTGQGNGMIVQRGFKQPPSFHIDRLRNQVDGYFFDIMTNGFGQMPSYAPQIGEQDRWAIVAYVRALQLSEHATVNDVPDAERAKLGGRS
jgi:mono/diheme cytochrome c family protein